MVKPFIGSRWGPKNAGAQPPLDDGVPALPQKHVRYGPTCVIIPNLAAVGQTIGLNYGNPEENFDRSGSLEPTLIDQLPRL